MKWFFPFRIWAQQLIHNLKGLGAKRVINDHQNRHFFGKMPTNTNVYLRMQCTQIDKSRIDDHHIDS